MRWSCVRSILIAVATLTCSSPALADEFVIQASPPSPEAATDVVVTIGDPSTAIDASASVSRIELPAVQINPTDASPAATVPDHVAAATPTRGDDLFIDPATGLMIPRFANPGAAPSNTTATSRTRAPARRHPASTDGRLHVDPVTGLMIPDFGASTFPTPSASATTTGRSANHTRRPAAATTNASLPGPIHFDPSTGLMIPSGMEMPHGTSTF